MGVALALLLASTTPAAHQILVSANDGKQVLVDGEQVVPSPRAPDGVSIIAFEEGRLRTIATVPVQTSIIGPPGSIAVTADGAHAVVSSARRVTVAGTGIEPDDVVSVIDLKRGVVVQTLHVGEGSGPAGIAMDYSGRRVLVANRAAGSVTLYDFIGGRLKPVSTLLLGAGSSPAQPMFLAGGDRALLTRDGDNRIDVLQVGSGTLSVDGSPLRAGLRPYALDVARSRPLAVVGAIGGGGRDVDTISLIDLSSNAPAVVDTVAVGLTPEGVSISPDGDYVAVTVNNGSNAPPASRHYHAAGLLQVWRIAAGRLVKVAETAMGGWGQGAVWSHDGRRIVAQAGRDGVIESFAFSGRSLFRVATLRLAASPAAIAGP